MSPVTSTNKNVHFLLVVDTDKPRVTMGPLLNRFESPDANVVNIGHTGVKKWDDDAHDDIVTIWGRYGGGLGVFEGFDGVNVLWCAASSVS